MRRLNSHLQPRILLVLRRAHWFSASHLSECNMVVRFRLSDALPHARSLCDPLLKPKRSDRNGKLQTIKSAPSIVPRGGFLQVAVSEAPLHSVSTPRSSLGGASDTALRLLGPVAAPRFYRIMLGQSPSGLGTQRQRLLRRALSNRRWCDEGISEIVTVIILASVFPCLSAPNGIHFAHLRSSRTSKECSNQWAAAFGPGRRSMELFLRLWATQMSISVLSV
jgi:hypothetical protein